MRRMLITGGSRGIGAKLAEYFAKEFEIFLHFNSGKKQADELASKIREQWGIVTLIQADLSKKTGPLIIADQITKLGGTLDVLINNAGLFQEGFCCKYLNAMKKPLAFFEVGLL